MEDFPVEATTIGEDNFPNHPSISINICGVYSDCFLEGEVRCKHLGLVAEGGTILGGVDTVESDTDGGTVYQDINGIAIKDTYDFSREGSIQGIGTVNCCKYLTYLTITLCPG